MTDRKHLQAHGAYATVVALAGVTLVVRMFAVAGRWI